MTMVLFSKEIMEGELVGADDGMSLILWSKYFIEAQGCTVETHKLFQDNKSTMLLEQNGRSSSSKRTKHIKSRYFFIQDKITDGDLEVEHCPTERMWANVLNKPKQGKVFLEFRAALMNCPVDYVDVAQMAASPKKICDVPPQCRSPKTIAWDQAVPRK